MIKRKTLYLNNSCSTPIYYATLSDKYFQKYEDAQLSEDKYVDDYFHELDRKVNQQRILRNQLVR